MPYIDEKSRAYLDNHESPVTAGELNYAVTRLVDDYLGDTPRYSNLNEIIGVLECAKLEIYRRLVSPYEDRKRSENGDVYRGRNLGQA
jgi:hypothetical protein